MCFRARWYDPETGRWLSKDPIGIAGGLNQYVAFGNNPVNFVDPSGLCEKEPSGKDPSWLDLFLGVNLVGQTTIGWRNPYAAVGVGIGAGAIATIETVGDIREHNQSLQGDQTWEEIVDEFEYYDSGTLEAAEDLGNAIGGF